MGDRRANWRVVATYPFPNAFAALQKLAKGSAVEMPGGGIALVDTKHPESIHFAFPGAASPGEIYDPSPAKAPTCLATSGEIEANP